ncbi:3-carboxymuconate cyclase [Arsenicibacter rosenii]|uniref:3-carboxymuconate cyclase n=1 Tax=Arsenicibacter rosenii TaxID=1750698 RepID=A0A1S2VP65_9BACT|nr:3-carboxymuconate cyclase [Arsenicibacter rosenii]
MAGTCTATPPARTNKAEKQEILYVGTYSTRGSEGIYVYAFDRKTATLRKLQAVSGPKSPSFLAVHPSGNYVYSVNEGAPVANGVSAYSVDGRTGQLTAINQESSHGRGPCHISIDQTGKLAFVSNYGGGTFAVLPVRADGSLGAATDSLTYSGAGPNKQRQEKPHIHSAIVSPDNRFVYVSDLGTDKIYSYAIDKATGKVKPAATPFVSERPGSGPRHFVFHPNRRFAYGVQELTSTVAVFAVDPKSGTLTVLEERIPTLPAGFTGSNTSADIHIDPKGRFLYQSNRGANVLSIFAIQPDGRLKLAGHQATMGKTPRNFVIDAKGEFLLAANQDTDTVIIFRIDPKTGLLTQVGEPVSIPAPVCLQLVNL